MPTFARRPALLAFLLPVVGAAAALAGAPAALAHPPEHRPAYPVSVQQPVRDVYHGEAVIDPYRWLEDGDRADVKAWTDAQNTLARKYLDAVPDRDALKARLRALYSPARQDPPVHRGRRYFFKRQDGKLPQAVLAVQDGLAGKPRTLIDPNPLAQDGTASLDWWEASPQGRYVAYGISQGGDEQSVLHLVDVGSRHELGETIPGCRYASIAWLPDERSFYYTRFPGAGATGTVKQRVYHHVVGQDPAQDGFVFEHPGGPEMISWVQLSADGRHMIIGVNKGSSSKNELYYRDLGRAGAPLVNLVPGFKAQYYGDVHQGTFYVLTDEGAPRRRVFAVDLRYPERRHWRPLIPQGPDTLKSLYLAGGKLVTESLHAATSRLALHDLRGRPLGQVRLPDLGTVAEVTARAEDRELFFSYTSYVQPTAVWRYDLTRGALAPFFAPQLPIAPGALVQRQVWYRSKDGTRVPMFLVARRDTRWDGRNPTMLTGYGGFDISLTPWFSAQDYVWVERGGVLAVPSLRGGGEFGAAWHEAGTKARKQNVFDDFAAAGEWLVRHGVTSPRHLGIEGGSNGGLLVGAAITQRPDLFQAAVCAVPLLDMLRYHKFLIAKYWVPEYGSSDDRAGYGYLKAYSPYHHVVAGRRYPATLLRTAESDTRVDPLHARKMAARLQAAQGGDAPILLYVEQRAGHGAGKPLTKRVEDAADTLGFLAWQLAR